METLFFAIISLVAIVTAILVVTCKNPINSALSLIMTFFCLALGHLCNLQQTTDPQIWNL